MTTARRRALVRATTAAVVLLAGAAGCDQEIRSHPQGFSVCGTHVGTGAMVPSMGDLNPAPPERPAPPEPATSVLPAQEVDARLTMAKYLRTSPNCDTGTTVSVTPLDHATLAIRVNARDGRPTMIGLHLTGPVTVTAWDHGNVVGSADLAGQLRPTT